MQKQNSMLDLEIIYSEYLNDQYFLLKLYSAEGLPKMYPGQFVQVKIDNSPSTFLRRPVSICNVDEKEDILWLLVKIVGEGTKTLSTYSVGAKVNMIIPLGRGYSMSKRGEKVLLVGGGVGVAPLLYLGRTLNNSGVNVNFLLGGRKASDLLLLDEFNKYGNVYFTTEDGSQGEKGFVTNHSVLKDSCFNMIYVCGPKPMMQAIALYARSNNINCEVSLENEMACGIGACLCCVEDTKEGNLCVCKEGPVFNIKRLKW